MLAPAALLGLMLAACGSEGVGSTSTPAEQAGCTTTQSQQTEELYVRELLTCDSDLLYIFDNKQARDNWQAVAESVGSVVLDEGDNWLRVKK